MGRIGGRVLTIFILLIISHTDALFACGFHNYSPEKSFVDRILESREVVTARLDDENPFKYKVVSRLKGKPSSVTFVNLVDSSTRRKLTANPNDAVLFFKNGNNDSWQRLAYLDSTLHKIVKTILARADSWANGNDQDRADYFATYYNHPNFFLQQQVLLELDRAPYDILQSLNLHINAGRIIEDLWSFGNLQFVQIHSLLLGLSKSHAAKLVIHEQITRSAFSKQMSKSIGAFAVALVELEGVIGVERLDTFYLKNSDHPLSKIELIVEALAIHSQVGDQELQETITEKLEHLVNVRPEASELIARQFGKRAIWTQKHYLRHTLKEKTTLSRNTRMLIENYINEVENS